MTRFQRTIVLLGVMIVLLLVALLLVLITQSNTLAPPEQTGTAQAITSQYATSVIASLTAIQPTYAQFSTEVALTRTARP